MATFNQIEVESIADALGDTEIGLTGTEIGHLLHTLSMTDPDPGITKRKRLHNALAADQNKRGNRRGILEFIRRAMAPGRWLNKQVEFERLRERLNQALSLIGLEVEESGSVATADAARTITDAHKRASNLKANLILREIHPDVLVFCKAELLNDNYFHAVLEAVKSVGDKLRSRTGLQDDGVALVNRALSGDFPMLAINPRVTKSEQDEQKGFANLIVGIFGMFRNPTAHEAKIKWSMNKEDAEDLLSLVSLVHRRLDAATMPSRI
nr:TIGR02391 family protein [uncultured Dongia sp.]